MIHNETNVGVIHTLNKGLLLAKGKYIARMDADDICLPQRFEKQVLYLDTNPEVVVVASHITQIDADEDDLGHWVHDIQTVTPSSIAQSTAKTNCIAHPSVMMQTSVIRSYKYNTKQKGSARPGL